MTGLRRSPFMFKGALVGLDIFNPVASITVFQYNPEKLTRSLTPRASGQGARADEVPRLGGPPTERITMDIEIDAADQLESNNPIARTMGIHPALAALEMLLYPKSAKVIINEALASAGMLEVIPPQAPLTLLFWGISRVVPVRLTQLNITEEAFDHLLNPVRASVSLDLVVLSYHELGLASVGGATFMAHQILKEIMASMSGVLTVGAQAQAAASIKIGVS